MTKATFVPTSVPMSLHPALSSSSLTSLAPHDYREEIRATALRIIRQVIEVPPFDKIPQSEIRRDILKPPPLSAFTHLEPMGFGLDQESWWIFNPTDCRPDVVWPLDVGMICDHAGPENSLVLTHMKTVQAKELRGVVSRISPFMVRGDCAQMECGQLATVALVFSWLAGQWNSATGARFELREKELPSVATGIALRQRYEWAVSLGLEGSPSIRFATDPTGIKDVFRIRDFPDHKDRREALMHWVSDHWRQNRSDPDLEIYVRQHLRGATAFSWRSMNCTLLPSRYDVEKRDRAMVERAAMRSTGRDRRPHQ